MEAAAPGLALDVMACVWLERANEVALPSALALVTVRLLVGAAAAMACWWSARAAYGWLPPAALSSGSMAVGLPPPKLSLSPLADTASPELVSSLTASLSAGDSWRPTPATLAQSMTDVGKRAAASSANNAPAVGTAAAW